MPWHHTTLTAFARCRPGDYGPITAEETALRAKVDACQHKRTSRIGRSTVLHCGGCGSTWLPDVTPSTSPVWMTLHSTSSSPGGESPTARWEREEREEDAARAERDAAAEEADVAPVEERVILDRERNP